MRGPTLFRAAVAVGAAALLTTGCLSSGGSSNSGGGGGGNTSKNIEIIIGFSGDQFKVFKSALDTYAKTQGITIKYSDVPALRHHLILHPRPGNNLPDIALFPQPGVMMDIAKRGS